MVAQSMFDIVLGVKRISDNVVLVTDLYVRDSLSPKSGGGCKKKIVSVINNLSLDPVS